MNDLSFLNVPLPLDVKREIILGNHEGARKIIKKMEKMDIHPLLKLRLGYELLRMERMPKDYPWSRREALKLLKERLRDFEEGELDQWIGAGLVDRAFIGGEERFYERFVDNLFFLSPKIAKRESKRDETNKYARRILGRAMARISKGDVRKYRIVTGIKINVKNRGNYRVWLPFPKDNFQIEKVKLIKAKPDRYFIAENNAPQRTIYFESEGKEFYVEFEYEISEIRGSMDGYAEPKNYLREKPPHIVFTKYIRDLAWKIVDGAQDDLEKAKRIYGWITRNTNYTYVREYCMYDNIGEYVASSLRGDCGMFAILFITLCRATGIPAKWQSGWFVTPKFASPHDWAQVYVNDAWIPVDASFGNLKKNGPKRQSFYFGNLDAYRMVANDDLLEDFIPEKRFWRSDPVDNQRGEVENEKRNLYFDEFSSHLYVKEFKRL